MIPQLILLVSMIASAGAAFGEGDASKSEGKDRPQLDPKKFTIARIKYDSVGGNGEGYYFYRGKVWQRWETDYPDLEENLAIRLNELTTIECNPTSVIIRLTDDRLFDYPFIFMSDVGWQVLNREERQRLREYLLRGGFLWIDDLWGRAEWENFEDIMREIMPECASQPIPKHHPILKIVYQLQECPQIPAIDFALEGWKWDPPEIHQHPFDGVEHIDFRGYSDKKGRLMIVVTHNTDIGDGMERETENEWFFENFSVNSYALAVNIVVYSLTH